MARYHHFTMSLADLELPEGSRTVFAMSTNIVANLNTALRQLRDEDEWVWIVGDDHVFRPDTLTRLLDRDMDMVVPLCTRRGPPFPLVHFGDQISEGSPYRRVLQYDYLPDDDRLVEVQATGSLPVIRRDVIDALDDPWFENTPGRMDEEFDFCQKVRDAGYRIWVDPTVAVGHISEIVTYPRQIDGVWGAHIDYLGADTTSAFYPGGLAHGALV
jgi:GT2 family glycosyltransferase